MNWTKVSDDEWRVPLDRFEGFMAKLEMMTAPLGYEFYSLNLKARFCTLDSFPRPTFQSVRSVWAQLRFEFPGLAALHDTETNEKVYKVPSPQDLEEWLGFTCIAREDVKDANELIRSLQVRPLPALYYLPQCSEVVFHCQHSRLDGIGCYMFMNRFFELLARSVDAGQIEWGDEIENLSPSIETAACTPLEFDDAIRERAEKKLTEIIESRPAVGLRYNGDAQTIPARVRNANLNFTPESTARIVKACKERNITVTVAVNAATILATHAHASEATKGLQWSGVMPHNLRPHLPAPYNTPSHALNLYISSPSISVPYGLSFPELTENLTTQYRSLTPTPEILRGLRAHIDITWSLAFVPPPAGSPPSSTLLVSSLGILDKHFTGTYRNADGQRVLEVEKLGIVIDHASREITAHLQTWRGRMSLLTSYNEAFYEEGYMREVLRSLKGELEKGLGVELEEESPEGAFCEF